MEKEYIYSQRLMGLRKEKEKTIAEMAYETGVSASTISNYERGVRVPDGKALMKFSQYFSCSADYLLGLSDIKSKDVRNQTDSFLQTIGSILDGITNEKEKDIMQGTVFAALSAFKQISMLPQLLADVDLKMATLLAESIVSQGFFHTSVFLLEILLCSEEYPFVLPEAEKNYRMLFDCRNDSIRWINEFYDLVDKVIEEECPKLITKTDVKDKIGYFEELREKANFKEGDSNAEKD